LRDPVEKPAGSRPWPCLGIAAVCLLLPSAPPRAVPAPVIAWPEAQYNPNPLPDDLILPLPCGGAMAFRSVTTPERADLAPKVAGRDFGAVAGPFRDRSGNPRFLLGKYEVNRLQVAAVGAYANGSDCPSPQLPDGRLASSTIGWQEAMTFGDDWTGWLLAQGPAIPDCTDGHAPCLPRADTGPTVVRLPTEGEWEFAARGGLAVPREVFAQSRYPMPDGIARYAWSKDNAGGQVHPIGTRAPGPLELHDLYGNVSEMLLERTIGATHQGQGPVFIVRGGGRYDPPEKLNADLRYEVPVHNEGGRTRTSDTGFRVVVSLADSGFKTLPIDAPGVPPAAPTGHSRDLSRSQDVPAETPLSEAGVQGLLDRFGIVAIVLGVMAAVGVGVGITTSALGLLGWFWRRRAEAVRRAQAAAQRALEADALVARERAAAERDQKGKARQQAEAQRQAAAQRQAEAVRQVRAKAQRQAEIDAQAAHERTAAERQADLEQDTRGLPQAAQQQMEARRQALADAQRQVAVDFMAIGASANTVRHAGQEQEVKAQRQMEAMLEALAEAQRQVAVDYMAARDRAEVKRRAGQDRQVEWER
jgi:hypothetical protein